MAKKLGRLLSLQEVAKMTGRKVWFWYNLTARTNRVPYVQDPPSTKGAKIMLREEVVEDWLQKHTIGGA